MLNLRPYQHALIAQARSALRAGHRRVLIQSATGSGKTVLIAQMLASAAQRGHRSWFVVHRKELLDQSVATFVDAADIHTGVVAAGYPTAPLAPVQVCSVQSLARRLSTLQPPDLLVWDECHHVASSTWAAIASTYPRALQIGLTATPARLDCKGLAPYFDTLIAGPSTADLIAQGYLSPYKLYAPSTVDTSHVHKQAGDYNRHELADTMAASTVVGDAVSTYRQHCSGARALVFVWSLEASRGLAEAFTAAGIPAAHVDGETPKYQRAEAMRQFRDGAIRALCNVELFGEGLDVPAVDAVFLLRPTQSLGLYLQQVGRGLRPAPGKPFVRVFDHVGNWQRHGLPDDPRAWSLAGAVRSGSTDAPMGRRCLVCFAVSRPQARVCAGCGALFPVQAREVEQVAGTLQEADVDVLRALGLSGAEAARLCRCGQPLAAGKRFCGSACFLAQRKQWMRRTA